jgi:hypothetical protein
MMERIFPEAEKSFDFRFAVSAGVNHTFEA